MTPTSWPLDKALSWAVDVDEGIDEEVTNKDELGEVEEEIERIDVAVLDVRAEAEAELDKEVIDVIGVAVVVKEGIAVVVSGVEATDDAAGEVEPPNVNSEPNGIYSRILEHYNTNF